MRQKRNHENELKLRHFLSLPASFESYFNETFKKEGNGCLNNLKTALMVMAAFMAMTSFMVFTRFCMGIISSKKPNLS